MDLDEVSTVKVESSLTLDPEGSVQKRAQNEAELPSGKMMAQSHVIFDGEGGGGGV